MTLVRDQAPSRALSNRVLTVFMVGDEGFLRMVQRLITSHRPRWNLDRLTSLGALREALDYARRDTVLLADASQRSSLGSRAVALTRTGHPRIPCIAYIDGFGQVSQEAVLADRLVCGPLGLSLVPSTIEHAVDPENGPVLEPGLAPLLN